MRLTNDWYAPLGGVLMTACAGFALTGFPLDDVWHRLFGQDVTLWGPTHLMLIGGAAMSTLATAMLVAEGLRAASGGRGVRRGAMKRFLRLRQALLAGALLVGLSTVQAEFDFSVPQFRLLYHPVLLMLAPSIALVAARIWIGRGGALMALGGYLAVRVMLSRGRRARCSARRRCTSRSTRSRPWPAEAVALIVSTRRPVVYGAAAGAAIGTFGLAAEWGWSHVWMTMPWPASLLPEAVIFGLARRRRRRRAGRRHRPRARARPPSGWRRRRAGPSPPRWLATVAAIAYPAADLRGRSGDGAGHADRRDRPARADRRRRGQAHPGRRRGRTPSGSTSPRGRAAVRSSRTSSGPARAPTGRPSRSPCHGNWKVTLRLHAGSAIQGLPIYMPEDTAIPAKADPGRGEHDPQRSCCDKKNLQREQKSGVPGVLTTRRLPASCWRS